MLPILKIAGDGQEHRISDVVDQLARDFRLTKEERQQPLPSGKQTTFADRVHWAKTFLGQAADELLRSTVKEIETALRSSAAAFGKVRSARH